MVLRLLSGKIDGGFEFGSLRGAALFSEKLLMGNLSNIYAVCYSLHVKSGMM